MPLLTVMGQLISPRQFGMFSILFQSAPDGLFWSRPTTQQINFLWIGFERNDRRCLSLGTARLCHEQTYPPPPSKINKTALICLWLFSFSLTPDLSIPVRYSLPEDLGLPHSYVGADHTWRRKWLDMITIRWPILLFQSPPQSPQEHEVSRRLFRPYTSPNHNVTKGRYITSNDPRGYMYVLQGVLNKDTL